MRKELLVAAVFSMGVHIVLMGIRLPKSVPRARVAPPRMIEVALMAPREKRIEPPREAVHMGVSRSRSTPPEAIARPKSVEHRSPFKSKPRPRPRPRGEKRRRPERSLPKQASSGHHEQADADVVRPKESFHTLPTEGHRGRPSPPCPSISRSPAPQRHSSISNKTSAAAQGSKGEAPLVLPKGLPRPPPRGPSRVKTAVARYEFNPPPPYPPIARRRGYQGKVVLLVRVLKDGTVGDVRVLTSSGYRILDEAALAAVKRWKFIPGRVGSNYVETEVKVPIRFRLR